MPFMPQGDWPVVPYVSRALDVKLYHPYPSLIDFYICSYPNWMDESLRKFTPLYDRSLNLQDGTETGRLYIGVSSLQDPNGEVTCAAVQAWYDEESDVTTQLTSEMSNSYPLGQVEPDPVTEPDFSTGLVIAVVVGFMAVKLRRFKKQPA